MILLEKKARNILKGGKKSKKVSSLISRESPVLTVKKSTRDSIFLSSPLPKPEPPIAKFHPVRGQLAPNPRHPYHPRDERQTGEVKGL